LTGVRNNAWDKVNYQLRLHSVAGSALSSSKTGTLAGLCFVNWCRAKCKFKQTAGCAIVSYTLADLELNLAERRLALLKAALDVREQLKELRLEAERPAQDAPSSQQMPRLWWRYY
jgi:hypothetical protein